MKKLYFFAVFLFLTIVGRNSSYAQLVGTNCFLQGQFTEVGINQMGAFGTCGSPANYHAHACCGTATAFTPGSNMDVAHDWGHDGWSVGSPALMGPYTQPGFPQEGWSVQVGATEYRNWASGAACTGPFNIPGSNTTYTNVGGNKKGLWVGNIAGLNIRQETQIDTLASWITVTTKIYNTTAAPIANVWYERTNDPDNTSFWSGTSVTRNIIVHQNEDARHRVQVVAHGNTPASGTTPAYTRFNSYMSLATKDCRAKCGVISGLNPTVTPSALWTGSTVVLSILNDSNQNDQGIFLVFNLGTIAPFDSTTLSYAYIYQYPNGHTGLDSALAEPASSIGGRAPATATMPHPGIVYDTFNVCTNPTTLLPIDLVHADDKTWTWSKWTWSPGTGLSATTGAHVIATTTGLPAYITYTVTGVDSAKCATRTMYITLITCNNVRANEPCYGDSLFLRRVGDSTGCTYLWWGPGGFTSTMQNPIKFPATYLDSGKFFVKRTVLGISDTDSIAVRVHYKPVVSITSNAPLCDGMFDTLRLDVNPGMVGMTYSWSGPASYSSVLKDPTRPGFDVPHVGTYTVVVTSPYGCKDTATSFAGLIPRPTPPVISNTDYCQGAIFNPFTVTGLGTGAVVWWWPSATGGPGSTTSPMLSTSTPGSYIVWASQRVGSCESQRAADTVNIIPTPPAPLVTGPLAYCQYIGPVVPLVVTPSDSVRWHNASVGGTFSYIQPLPDINVPGALNMWVSRMEDGCESPRTPVTRNIHPKPAPPIPHPQSWCQFKTANPIDVTPSGAGDVLTYYGPGVTSGMLIAPTPSTSVAPDTIFYYITETTAFGCISDSAIDKVVIRLKPAPPTVTDLQYCQKDIARPLNEVVDSDFNSTLNWYYNSISLPPIPVPFTDTTPGTRMWFVGQTVPAVNGCASDSIPIKVTIIYKPKFSIEATSPWVCQFDTVTLAYKGPALYQPEYLWTFPRGAAAVNFTDRNDSIVQVKFDSTHQDNYVYLRASNHNGFCYSDTSIRIKVIPLPTMEAYTKPDVCFGDTVQLALATKADNSHSYTWWVDDTTMEHARALSIISRNSHSSGPYTISWLDSGRHIIKVSSTTVEGCKSEPTFDSVLVHNPPDARFRISSGNQGKICWEDSVQFTALTEDYRNSYEWAPAHDFDNLNSPIIWGKMLGQKNTIILKVTDPFGCYATESMQIDPEYCCTIQFPNAFTPNGTGPQDNNIFKPYFVGYHRFHMFRIMNRWGQIIFESANSSVMGWDGTFNGVPQDVGVYYYYLRYDCGGKSMEAKGDVALIR